MRIATYTLVTSLLLLFAVCLAGCGGAEACSTGDCTCIAGTHCDLTCTQAGGCRQQCDGNCGVTCMAGTCRQQCSAGSTCTMGCVGGGCMQQCALGATCTFTCEGGNCTQVCQGSSTCRATCTGLGCTTETI